MTPSSRMCRPARGAKQNFHTLHKLSGLVSYLDWILIIVNTSNTVLQLFETPHCQVMVNP